MNRQLLITFEPINELALQSQRVMSSGMGAVAGFIGVVRGQENDQPIEALEYEAFTRMAERQINIIYDELERRWPIESVRVVHRLGVIKAGEASLWVELIAPHRREAFDACQYLIDELKRLAPIWKKPCLTGPL